MSKKVEADVSPYTLRRIRHEVAKSGRVDKAVEAEILALSEDQQIDLFRPSAQCRICRTEGAAQVTNKMLAHGATHQDVMDVLQPLNLRRKKNEQITLNSIGHHARNHFPLEEAAQAVYRRIIEKRAEEAEIDFVKGVGGAVTALGFLDIVLKKGLENVVKDDVEVSVDQGIRAAKEIGAIEATRDASGNDINEARVQLNQIIEAVRLESTPEQWDRIVARLKGEAPPQQYEVLEAETEEEYVEPGFDPGDPDWED